ncbi:hypothetical protein G6N05_07860 [Flavobacterium sp. F372]|uniref:Uncharacterized protein n=1 Tax=Flavobacterium bernardetii TaxID=2813823 RepID=A0ABR7IX38_9FLAO|nr:hypothetical protein [Flavobacterium bernardetii]MBC5834339.1 hypothetical protein [Flavobacterium bernardetii]NHF70022.1 hypothetical protein [Flavobacterium bernardetii]
MESIKLISPINNSLANIKESLFKREVISIANESILYGTFENEFENFSIDSKRLGKTVYKIDFLYSKLEQLNKIEIQVLNFEKQNENIEYSSTLKAIQKLRNLISEFISFENQPLKRNEKTILTYKKIVKDDKINTLFNLLKKNNLIEKKTSFKDFSIVFNNKNISDIVNPIVWLSSNASELLYFIINIQDVIIEKTKRQNYLLLKSCFLKPNGIEFSENFKNINTELEIKLSKEKQRTIYNIIQEIAI